MVSCLIRVMKAGAFFTGLFFLKDTGHVNPLSVARMDSKSTWAIVSRLFRRHDFVLILIITLLTQFEGTCLEAALPLLLVQEQVLFFCRLC
jgi:hypothetical protein